MGRFQIDKVNDEPEWEGLDDDEVFMIVAFNGEESLILMNMGRFLHWCESFELLTSLDRLPVEYIPTIPDHGLWAFEGHVTSSSPRYGEQIGPDYSLNGDWRKPTIDECRTFMEFADDQ